LQKIFTKETGVTKQNQTTDDLALQQLNVDSFVQSYRQIIGMRFPVEVADVLEIRASLNQAIDERDPKQVSNGLQQFNEAVYEAISQIGLKNERHIIRLTKLMSIFRDLHHSHNTRSRKHERSLRNQIKNNQEAKSRSIGYGLFTFVLVIVGLLSWMIAGNALWFIKAGIGLLAYMSFDYFMSLKTLKLEYDILNNELNMILRRRVQTIDWKSLLQKSAMLLGFKKISGVDVFLLGETGSRKGFNRTVH
jgi:hypothetical protein